MKDEVEKFSLSIGGIDLKMAKVRLKFHSHSQNLLLSILGTGILTPLEMAQSFSDIVIIEQWLMRLF